MDRTVRRPDKEGRGMLATDAARPVSTRGALGRALALAPLVALSVLVLMLAHALPAQAATSHGAVVGNGTVQLGVNAAGDLNYNCVTTSDAVCPKPSAGNGVAAVGLRFQPLNLDSTSPGCLCEGWGAADAGSKLSGSANEDNGAPVHLAVDSFSASSAAEAISTVTISDPAIAGKKMRVVRTTTRPRCRPASTSTP